MTRVLALDLSLVATGVADENGTRVIKAPKRQIGGAPRLAYIHDSLFADAPGPWPDVAIIESAGYFKGDAQYVLELHGVVKLALYRLGIPFVLVAPSSVKRFATGSGVADKDHMLAAAIRRFAFEGSNNNEADAWIMYMMGLAHYHPPDNILKYEADVLARIAWPELKVTIP